MHVCTAGLPTNEQLCEVHLLLQQMNCLIVVRSAVKDKRNLHS